MTKVIKSNPFHPDWSDASWNISGLFAYDTTLDLLFKELEKIQSLSTVKSVHGAPQVTWNGGRYKVSPVSLDMYAVRDRIQAYNNRGISVGLTFTNSLLDKEDVENRIGNDLLEIIYKGFFRNFVVVNSSILSEHIHKHYPGLLQMASITKVAIENGKGKLHYYRQLEEKFQSVVLHPDDNLNWDLIAELNKSQLEVCVNEQCIVNCPVRPIHYRLSDSYIYSQSSEDLAALDTFEAKTCICGTAIMDRQQNPKALRRTALTKPEVKQLYDMGVRMFKIQSRRDPNFGSYNLLYDICHYVLEPHSYAELCFKKILRMILREVGSS